MDTSHAVRVVVELDSGQKLPREVTVAPGRFVRINHRPWNRLRTSIIVYGGIVLALEGGIELTVPHSGTCFFPKRQVIAVKDFVPRDAQLKPRRRSDNCWNCGSKDIGDRGPWSRECGNCGHRWRGQKHCRMTRSAA